MAVYGVGSACRAQLFLPGESSFWSDALNGILRQKWRVLNGIIK